MSAAPFGRNTALARGTLFPGEVVSGVVVSLEPRIACEGGSEKARRDRPETVGCVAVAERFADKIPPALFRLTGRPRPGAATALPPERLPQERQP
jgi:hypothetical protein